jgi:hypothetical protein
MAHAGGCTQSPPHAKPPLKDPQSSFSKEANPKERGDLSQPKEADDACGLPEGMWSRGWPRKLQPTSREEPVAFVPGSTTLAVLPDTQYYVKCGNTHFARQSEYIAQQMQARNIIATISLGDLTEHNTDEEWQFVQKALAPIAQPIPLLLATGNHDHGHNGSADERSSLFTKYFSAPGDKTRAVTAVTMNPNNWENAYYRLPFKTTTLGVLILEWSPRHETVAWAKQTLDAHAEDRVIFVTHAYLYYDGTRYDWASKGDAQEWNPKAYGTAKKDPRGPAEEGNWAEQGAYDGQMLWEALLQEHPGAFLTLNGHVLGDGAGLLSEATSHGNIVHQVLVNYQMLDEGGLGYLRLIEISPDGTTMTMKTYSPSLGLFATAPDQNFTLEIQPPLL